MRKLFVSFFIFLSLAIANAQTWLPVGNGVNGYINTLFVNDSVMYAGGLFTGPGNNIAQWNGSTWNSLGSGINNQVYAMGSYKGLMYIGGWFTNAGGHSAGGIATWNGTAFANAGFEIEHGHVQVIHTYDSLLYIGGTFDTVNHKLPFGLVTWNGIKVDSLHVNYGAPYDVSIMTTYNNMLLMSCAPAATWIAAVATWNNKKLLNLGNYYFNPARFLSLNFNAFCQQDSNLYMGGSFWLNRNTYTGPYDTANNIAMWNGKKWSKLGKGTNGTVNALIMYNNLLIAGGSFDSAGGVPVNHIAAWNGTSWSAVGNGVNGTIYSLAVFKNHLYAAGDFSSPGMGITEYIDTTYIINNDSVNVFPNPNSGQFTVVCNRVITQASPVILDIYDIQGKEIYSANMVDGNNIVDLGKESSGIYLYKITSSGQNLINPGKLIIENKK